jgi:cytochrome c2
MRKLILAISLTAAASAALAAGDPAQGKQAYQACAACHSVTQGTTGVGPSLFGVVGRKAGSAPGFNYSQALKASNLTWTAQNLDGYIADPQKKIPGNHMPYAGMSDAQLRGALIAYLETLH